LHFLDDGVIISRGVIGMYVDKQCNQWWKGNLHLHTTVSDGQRTPEEACRLYREAGYDFIARTDHWLYGEETVSPEGLLVLSGCEYNIGGNVVEGIYHIVSVGTTRDPGLTKGQPYTATELVEAIHKADGLAVLAHPAWSLNTPEQMLSVKGVDCTEIFNSVSDLPRNCRPYSGLLTDMLAAQEVYLPLIATDDTHFYEQADLCRSFICVKAPTCTRDDLMAALRAGDFYASQGPQLDVRLQNGVLTVDCSPVEEIVYHTGWVWSPHRSQMGEGLTHGEYTVSGADRFVRVEVRDAQGRYAWSPYFPIK